MFCLFLKVIVYKKNHIDSYSMYVTSKQVFLMIAIPLNLAEFEIIINNLLSRSNGMSFWIC